MDRKSIAKKRAKSRVKLPDKELFTTKSIENRAYEIGGDALEIERKAAGLIEEYSKKGISRELHKRIIDFNKLHADMVKGYAGNIVVRAFMSAPEAQVKKLQRRAMIKISTLVKTHHRTNTARSYRSPSRATFQKTGTDDSGGDPDSSEPAKPSKSWTAIRPFNLQIHGAPVSAHNQRQKIIQFLLDGGTATQREFRAIFNMEQPAARVCELRQLGWRIKSLHLDPENPQVVSYRLDLRRPFIKPKAKKIKPTPTMTLPFDTCVKVAAACNALLSAIEGGDVR